MFKKILLVIKIILSIVINVLVFTIIFQNSRSQYALTDTLFFLGIMNLVYGLGAIFIISRTSGGLYIQSTKAGAVNLALADQNIKNYHKGDRKSYNKLSLVSKYLKVAHIIAGIILCISAVIVYST